MENIKTTIQLHKKWLNKTGGKQLDIKDKEFNRIILRDEDLNTAIFYNIQFASVLFSHVNITHIDPVE